VRRVDLAILACTIATPCTCSATYAFSCAIVARICRNACRMRFRIAFTASASGGSAQQTTSVSRTSR
jgi:hypothetical protein